MAAFIAFYCGKKKEDGSFVGVRAAGNEYPIADDQFVLDFFAGMTGQAGCGNRARRADQRRFLGQRPDRRASGL